MSLVFHDVSSFYWLGLQGQQTDLVGLCSAGLPNNFSNFDTIDMISFNTKYLYFVKSTWLYFSNLYRDSGHDCEKVNSHVAKLKSNITIGN